MKVALLEAYQPQDYRGDVWLLTERDAGARIDGSRNDLLLSGSKNTAVEAISGTSISSRRVGSPSFAMTCRRLTPTASAALSSGA